MSTSKFPTIPIFPDAPKHEPSMKEYLPPVPAGQIFCNECRDIDKSNITRISQILGIYNEIENEIKYRKNNCTMCCKGAQSYFCKGVQQSNLESLAKLKEAKDSLARLYIKLKKHYFPSPPQQ